MVIPFSPISEYYCIKFVLKYVLTVSSWNTIKQKSLYLKKILSNLKKDYIYIYIYCFWHRLIWWEQQKSGKIRYRHVFTEVGLTDYVLFKYWKIIQWLLRVHVKKKQTREETVREHENGPKEGEEWWRGTEWKQVQAKKEQSQESHIIKLPKFLIK